MLHLDPDHLLDLVDHKLIEILNFLSKKVGVLTVTSLYRKGDKGIHGTFPCRGIDVRCRDKIIGRAYARVVNNRWSYDQSRPDRMCAVPHNVGFGFHLHLQVHPNTKENV